MNIIPSRRYKLSRYHLVTPTVVHSIPPRSERLLPMLVPLDSPDGQKRLEEAAACTTSSGSGRRSKSALQRHAVDAFRKQRGNTVCGLASLAVVLTARNRCRNELQATDTQGSASYRDPPHETNNKNHQDNDKSLFVDEDDVYPGVASSATQGDNGEATIVSEQKIQTSGMTLDQIRTLAKALPTTKEAMAIFPSTKNDNSSGSQTWTLSGTETLRELLVEVLSVPSSHEGLILNYHMSTLGQVPFGGHLSPVAAYHESTDSVLILDVWHTQTEPIWAPVETVWKSIQGIDPESRAPRGLLRVVHLH